MLVDVQCSEYLPKLDEKQTTERVDILLVFNVAPFHVLLAIEKPHSLIKEVFLAVARRKSDEEFRNEAANGKFDVDVAVVEGRVLAANESKHLDDIEPVPGGLAVDVFQWSLSEEFTDHVDGVLTWMKQADVKDLDNFVDEDGHEALVPEWKIPVFSHVWYFEGGNVV